MQSSRTFRISRPITFRILGLIEYWDGSKQSKELAYKLGLFQKWLGWGDLGESATSEIFSNFYSHLNCYTAIQISTFFSPENCQFNHKLDSPFSITNILCLKDYPNNLAKYEIKGISKIPISLLFSKFGITALAYLYS